MLKDVVVFELDQPATQARKVAVLKSFTDFFPAHLHFIPIVFNRENLKDRMLAAGYQTHLQTLFIWEGVTYYLPPGAIDHTLAFVSGFSPSKSCIIFDFFPPSVANGTSPLSEAHSMRVKFKKFGEAFTFGISPGEMPRFLWDRGYKDVCVFPVHRLKKEYLTGNHRHRRISGIFFLARAGV
jgi:methyltransferase (TIGR00027 family)